MSYTVQIERVAQRDLKKFSSETLKRMLAKLKELENEPRTGDIRKLSGVDGYRVIVGSYRILFTINDQEQAVKVYRIKHRKEAYRE